MSLLNPTPEELQARHRQRQADLAARAERLRRKRRTFVSWVAMVGALLFALSCRASAIGGHMAWAMWFLSLVSGATLAGMVAWSGMGMVRGILVYGLGCFSVWMLAAYVGWWRLIDAGGTWYAALVPVLVMLMSWLGLLVAGGIIGWLSDSFDNDTQQL